MYWGMKKNKPVAPEVREQILRRIKEEGISAGEAAKDAGVHETTIYAWLGRGIKGNPSLGELMRLRRENQELLALVGELTLQHSRRQKKI